MLQPVHPALVRGRDPTTACATSSCLGKAPSSCFGEGTRLQPVPPSSCSGKGPDYSLCNQLLFGEGTRLQPVHPALVWGRDGTRLQPVHPALVRGRNPTTACAPSSCSGKAPSSCLGKGPDYSLCTQLLFGEGTRLQPVHPALVQCYIH